jgi:hypothetical protein
MGSSAYCLKNLTSYTIYAPFNYWNANSTNEISAKIWDYFDNPTNLGPVIFEPFYTNQISWIGAGW